LTTPITRDQAKDSLTRVQDKDAEKEHALRKGELERVELDGRRRFYRLRTKWSWAIIGWISCLIAFNIVLTILVGVKVLDFSEYQWFITAVTVETFLQVIGMGVVAVKFLFSKGDK
jgi:hypothetical protein